MKYKEIRPDHPSYIIDLNSDGYGGDIEYIIQHLTYINKEELKAWGYHYTQSKYITVEILKARVGFILLDENCDPCALFCLSNGMDTLASITVLGTDELAKNSLKMFREIKAFTAMAAKKLSLNRVECRILKGNTFAESLMRIAGGVKEAELVDFGVNRETFLLYAWRRTDYDSHKSLLSQDSTKSNTKE